MKNKKSLPPTVLTAFFRHLPSAIFQLRRWKPIGRHRSQVVRQFGNAKLIRRPNGQHELIGGTDADRTEAYEWTSLFAHEIVFTHFYREDQARTRPRKPWFTSRLQPACQ